MTKLEYNNYKQLVLGYYDDNKRALQEDYNAVGLTTDTPYQKAVKMVEAGFFGVWYNDIENDLKGVYGTQFTEDVYKTKAGDWRIVDGEVYIWTVYKHKMAQTIIKILEEND